jgi:ABC-type phosphate transport system auxiliary subunit
VKTAALVTVAVIALVVVVMVFAIRGLRKFVRSVWPHS